MGGLLGKYWFPGDIMAMAMVFGAVGFGPFANGKLHLHDIVSLLSYDRKLYPFGRCYSQSRYAVAVWAGLGPMK
jgi:hypothetical protein